MTRGERGEVVPGPFSALQGTPGLAAHRETELAAALFMLGVQDHAFLGNPPARAAGLDAKVYEDSGMEWGSDGWATAAADAPDTALTRAPAVEALNDLLALADEWGAEAIVSYGARGGYGHPDHVFAHRAARAVAHGLELPFWEIVAGADAGAGAARDRQRRSCPDQALMPMALMLLTQMLLTPPLPTPLRR
ncbi:PIG-L family deacetylase [Leucobacter soli]|uniref:PIG-L family deacetylase n=1 Tax=Leucobacter soli TaxID=2812850 RepID=UPI00361859AC